MSELRGLRLGPSAALKERRLSALLAGRDPSEPTLRENVEDAQLLGSLELAGFRFSWQEVKASRGGEPAPPEVTGLLRARKAVAAGAPLDVASLRAWHAAASGGGGELRKTERARPQAPPPAAPEFIAERLERLAEWLEEASGRQLGPAPRAALALARIVEILPFEGANGRVSRLAASHLMVRGGMRPPILAGGDRPRLEACLQAAFRLETEPVTSLLEEASERALDVMIQTLDAARRV